MKKEQEYKSKESTDFYFKLALDLEDKKRYEDALQYYKKVVEIDKNHFMAWLNSGAIYSLRSQFLKAIFCFQRSVKIKKDPRGYYNLSVAYFRIGEYDQSRNQLSKAIRLEPNFFKAHLLLGYVCSRLNYVKQAENSILKAIEIEPQNRSALIAITIFYFNLKKYDLAYSYLDAFTSAKDLPFVHKIKGKISLEKGDVKQSIEHFQKEAKQTKEISPLQKIIESEMPSTIYKNIESKHKTLIRKKRKEKKDWLDLSVLALFKNKPSMAMDYLLNAIS